MRDAIDGLALPQTRGLRRVLTAAACDYSEQTPVRTPDGMAWSVIEIKSETSKAKPVDGD